MKNNEFVDDMMIRVMEIISETGAVIFAYVILLFVLMVLIMLIICVIKMKKTEREDEGDESTGTEYSKEQ